MILLPLNMRLHQHIIHVALTKQCYEYEVQLIYPNIYMHLFRSLEKNTIPRPRKYAKGMYNANIRWDLWPHTPIDFDLWQFNERRPKIANQIFSCQLGLCISGYQDVRSGWHACQMACSTTLEKVPSSGACRAQIFSKLRFIYDAGGKQTQYLHGCFRLCLSCSCYSCCLG